MKTFLIFLLLIFISFSSCDKMDDLMYSHYISYTIQHKNHHSSVEIPGLHSGREMRFNATFEAGCIYETKEPSNQDDINKLYGFSDCGDAHHTNSARFGWRWNLKKSKIEIFAYTYAHKTVAYKYITDVDIDANNEYSIKIVDHKYLFTINGIKVEMDRGCSNKHSIKYHLFPYFGGDETAPHSMTIKIKQLN